MPFYRHPDLVALLRDMNVIIGTHHDTDKAAQKITSHISIEMHKILLLNLVNNDLPFSLIVDGTTDNITFHTWSH